MYDDCQHFLFEVAIVTNCDQSYKNTWSSQPIVTMRKSTRLRLKKRVDYTSETIYHHPPLPTETNPIYHAEPNPILQFTEIPLFDLFPPLQSISLPSLQTTSEQLRQEPMAVDAYEQTTASADLNGQINNAKQDAINKERTRSFRQTLILNKLTHTLVVIGMMFPQKIGCVFTSVMILLMNALLIAVYDCM
eukprot:416204_1